MTGTVQVKKGKWYCVLNFKDENGKRVKKWFSTGLPEKGNKRKAERILEELKLKYSQTGYVEPTKILFSDYLLDWLESRRPNIEPTTYAGYKRICGDIIPYFAERKVLLKQLTAKHIQDYCAYKSAKPRVGPNTVIKHMVLISSALKNAKKLKLIRENPAELVDKPKKKKFVGNYYNNEETAKLLEVIKGSSIEAPLMFGIYFGLRRSEILGIKWSAIDFASRKLSISHKVVPVNDIGKYRLNISDNLKNNASYRTMSIDETFISFLRNLRERQESNKKFFGKGYNYEYEDYICVNDIGELIKPNYVSIAFRKLLEKHNLRRIRLHDLRHSCATLLLSLGYGLKDIQEYLGHGEIGTTANFYTHVQTSTKQSMIEGIAKALGGN